MKVSTEDLVKSMEYLEIEVPESLRKSLQEGSLEGSEQNGGGSEPNDLEKKKKDLKEKLEKAKKELEDLEKANKELEDEESEEDEGLENQPPMGTEKESSESSKKEEDLKKSLQEVEELKTTVTHLTNLVKSQNETLSTLSRDVNEALSSPVERRSAESLEILRKSMGGDPVEEKKNENKISILQKGRVSQALMDTYNQGGGKDEFLAEAIMTYEASGYLSPSVVNFMKGKGVEIETIN